MERNFACELAGFVLKQVDLLKYHIVRFASHAVAGDKLGIVSQPALILSQKASTEVESLQFADILNLKSNADLVVLSACETGLGRTSGWRGHSERHSVTNVGWKTCFHDVSIFIRQRKIEYRAE